VRVLPPAPCRPIPQLATGPAEEGGPSDMNRSGIPGGSIL